MLQSDGVGSALRVQRERERERGREREREGERALLAMIARTHTYTITLTHTHTFMLQNFIKPLKGYYHKEMFATSPGACFVQAVVSLFITGLLHKQTCGKCLTL